MRWIERQKNFLEFTLSSMLRRKGKNGMLIAAYTLVVFLLASVMFFAKALQNESMEILAESPQIVVQRMTAGRHEMIPETLADSISRYRGVVAVEPRLWGYYFHPASGANYTVMAVDDFKYGEEQAVVGNGVIRTWKGLEEGKIYFRSYDGSPFTLDIVDNIGPDTEIVSADLIVVSKDTFRRLFGLMPGLATDLAVTVANIRECPTIAEKIVTDHPDLRTILHEDIQLTYSSIFSWRSGYVVVLLAGAVFAFLIFAWDRATGLSAEERFEIGILKALGWDVSDVLFVKFWEGLVISLTSFGMGVLLAYAHVFMTSAVLFEHALKGWSVLYPDFELRSSVDVSQLMVLFFFTVVPYTLITVLPSWKTAATDPDTVMR